MRVRELLEGEALWLMLPNDRINVIVRYCGEMGAPVMEIKFPMTKGETINREIVYFGQPVVESRIHSWTCDGMGAGATNLYIVAWVDTPSHGEESRKRRALMETAMCIMETYDDMCAEKCIDPTAADEDTIERLGLFSGWAEEFEAKYRKESRYEDDFLNLVREFAEGKIKSYSLQE